MSRMTNYLALMIPIYALFYSGKLMYDAIVGNSENVFQSVFYSILLFAFAIFYYIYIYRPFKGK
jgi:hypothetical protein